MTNVLLLVFPVIFARAATPSVRHTCRSYQRHHTVPSARSSSHARRAGLAAAPLQTDTLVRTRPGHAPQAWCRAAVALHCCGVRSTGQAPPLLCVVQQQHPHRHQGHHVHVKMKKRTEVEDAFIYGIAIHRLISTVQSF